MDVLRINIGPLTSFNSLVFYISPKLKTLRDAYVDGQSPKVIFDFSSLDNNNISVPALAAFLSLSKVLREFLGYTIPIITDNWNPFLLGFLADIGFEDINKKFNLFEWYPKELDGGSYRGNLNPHSKIFYYADINPASNFNLEELGTQKAILKNKIEPHFNLKCANIFKGFDKKLESIVSRTALELIVNCLMHAEQVAFVGLQRSNKRITVSVCDSGIGFPESLSRTFGRNKFKSSDLRHIDGIILGSLVQRSEHGLRLGINEVLNYDSYTDLEQNYNEGWVVISSYNCELRWQKKNWGHALQYYEENYTDTIENFKVEKILGPEIKGKVDMDIILEGYWKLYEHFLVGTRITFEIPLI
jgi:hypothetical protein